MLSLWVFLVMASVLVRIVFFLLIMLALQMMGELDKIFLNVMHILTLIIETSQQLFLPLLFHVCNQKLIKLFWLGLWHFFIDVFVVVWWFRMDIFFHVLYVFYLSLPAVLAVKWLNVCLQCHHKLLSLGCYCICWLRNCCFGVSDESFYHVLYGILLSLPWAFSCVWLAMWLCCNNKFFTLDGRCLGWEYCVFLLLFFPVVFGFQIGTLFHVLFVSFLPLCCIIIKFSCFVRK